MRRVFVLNAGLMKYTDSLQLQQRVSTFMKQASSSTTDDSTSISGILILLEHYPVYTVGIRNKTYSAEMEQRLVDLGADFIKTNRGGLITFHGPGQLVAYPVLNLKRFEPSIRWYLRHLENTAISVCKSFNVEAVTSPDTGVWVGNNKICAMGVHASSYITTHGLGLNCNTDLKWFSHIVPCGLVGKGVTSLSKELDRDVAVEEVIPQLLNSFGDCFDCQLIAAYTEHEINQFINGI